MRNRSFTLFVLACTSLAWSQTATPPTPPAAPSTAAPTASKPRGPEAVAAAEPNKVVAVIEGKDVTAKQALELLKPFTPEERKRYEPNLSNLIQQLYMQQRMSELALKMNMDQQFPWKDRLVLSRETVLAQAYLTHLNDEAAKAPADDPKTYYDAHPDEFEQVKLGGIFVNFAPPGTPTPQSGAPTKTEPQAEEKANEIEKKLKAGGDFAALARTDNDNPAGATQGGDLGVFNMGDEKLPPALRSAISKLQPGQVSEPIRVNNAFLILKLDSRQKQTFAEVQPTLADKLRKEKNQSLVKQEVDKYKIKVQDEDFFAAAGSRPMPSLQKPMAPPTPGAAK